MAAEETLSITTTSERALGKCFPELQSFLNCDAAIPYLVKYELITRREYETLMLKNQTNSDKVDLLFKWLPSKPGFVGKFLACLRESAEKEGVPGHKDLAHKLEEELKAIAVSNVGQREITIDARNGLATEKKMQGRPGKMSDYDGREETPVTEKTPVPEGCAIGSVTLKHCKKWLLCYVSLSFAAILALILLIVLASTPAVSDDVIPSDLLNNDTVEIHFNLDNRWLRQATLSTVRNCNGPLFIIRMPCLDLVERYTHTIPWDNPEPDFVYLLPGSSINFVIPASADTDVWVFTDSATANDYSRNPGSYSCNHPPPDVDAFCFKTRDHNGTFQHNITKAAYYFIRCPVQFSIGWSFDRVLYNLEDLSRDFKPDINVSSLGRVAQLNKPFQFSKSCVLLHVNLRSCGSPGNGRLQVMEVKRRLDILLFPSLLLALSLTAVAIIHCIHCACVYRWKRGTKTTLTELQ